MCSFAVSENSMNFCGFCSLVTAQSALMSGFGFAVSCPICECSSSIGHHICVLVVSLSFFRFPVVTVSYFSSNQVVNGVDYVFRVFAIEG